MCSFGIHLGWGWLSSYHLFIIKNHPDSHFVFTVCSKGVLLLQEMSVLILAQSLSLSPWFCRLRRLTWSSSKKYRFSEMIMPQTRDLTKRFLTNEGLVLFLPYSFEAVCYVVMSFSDAVISFLPWSLKYWPQITTHTQWIKTWIGNKSWSLHHPLCNEMTIKIWEQLVSLREDVYLSLALSLSVVLLKFL